MVTKPLPTFKHTSIGAKTHKARTATAHVSYIMRSDAMTEFQAENMPEGGRGTRVFFDKLWEKAGMPENARIKEADSQKEKANANGCTDEDHPSYAPAPEHIEKRTLREAQSEVRKAFYADQQQDRDALRLAHETEKRQHENLEKEAIK